MKSFEEMLFEQIGSQINGTQKKGRVTLDEDDNNTIIIDLATISYFEKLAQFEVFKENFTHYLLYDKCVNTDAYTLWKVLWLGIIGATDTDIAEDNKVCVMVWLENNWGAWLECILNGTFKYMNISGLILKSWKEFCEE